MSAGAGVRTVTGATGLAALLTPGRTVVLCLTGAWCGSCSAFEAVLAEVADDPAGAGGPDAGSPVFAVADTQVASDLAAAFAVRTVPTTLLLREGMVLDRLDGPVTRRELRARLARATGPVDEAEPGSGRMGP